MRRWNDARRLSGKKLKLGWNSTMHLLDLPKTETTKCWQGHSTARMPVQQWWGERGKWYHHFEKRWGYFVKSEIFTSYTIWPSSPLYPQINESIRLHKDWGTDVHSSFLLTVKNWELTDMMALNPALRKLRQEDSHKFVASLGHIVNPRPAWAGQQRVRSYFKN